MRTLLAILSCALAFALCGCSPREEEPKPKTVAEVQAEIDKVQNDPKMPPGVKSMVLGLLQNQKEKAQKQAAAN